MQKNNVPMTDIDELKQRLVQLAYLRSGLAVLGWDQEVNMPKKAAVARAKTLAELQGITHEKFVGIDHDGLLSQLKKDADTGTLSKDDEVIVREAWRAYDRARKLPGEFVKEMAEVTSVAQSIWAQARAQSDFSLFEPQLKQIIDLKKREAEYIGYKNSPYDALIDDFEPDMTTEEASIVLTDLKNFLIPFIAEIKEAQKISKKKIDVKKLHGHFPIEAQYKFNTFISEKIGFDLEAGRIDMSTHPFTTSFHPTDVRYTTRYREHDVLYALGSTIHEAGHGLYEQGLPEFHFGTALGETASLGIHESQSRMWENIIGKSREFWKYFYPRLQKEFPKPFKKILFEDFYKILNNVEPSFIRTEADEVTYNLHIVLRFEIERDLIEGKLAVKDAPRVWNEKMKKYFGLKVTKDSLGILQDVHWSGGMIGYFPTYSLGNLYAAQFYSQMQKDIPSYKRYVSSGNFKPILDWLRKNIHARGKKLSAKELVKEVTGEELSSAYFAGYLKNKFKDMYGI